MIFKNIDFHNVSEITECEDGSYMMHRFPLSVEDKLEGGQNANRITTGVELRFKIKSGIAKITFKNPSDPSSCPKVLQYRGSILDTWQNYSFSVMGGQEYTRAIPIHPEINLLEKVTEDAGYAYSPEVVRLVINQTLLRFVDVEGDIEPPSLDDLPKRKYLAYGSSITHGSQCYSAVTSFVSQVAEYFRADPLNRGLAGNARLEKEVADEIAAMGKRGEWDFATLCLGINLSNIPAENFRQKVRYMLETVSIANPHKPIFAISPVFSRDDMIGMTNLSTFRTVIEEEVARLHSANLHYINGLSLLSGPGGLSADLVHPSPDGANQIALNLINGMKPYI